MNPVLDYLKSVMKNAKERKFLSILTESNRVRYAWGSDVMWVWLGEKEPTEGNALYMQGETFTARMYKADKETAKAATSADFIVDLLLLGIDVQIAWTKPIKRRNFVRSLTATARKHSKNGQIGKLTMMKARYAK